MAKKEKYLCLAPEFQLIFSKAPSLWSFTSSVVYLLLSPCFDPPNQQIPSIFSLTQLTFVPRTWWLWGEITHEVHFVKNRIPSTIQLFPSTSVQILGCIFNSWGWGLFIFCPKKLRSISASCRHKPGLAPNSPRISSAPWDATHSPSLDFHARNADGFKL